MADILIFDPETGDALSLLKSVNTPDYIDRKDCIVVLPEGFDEEVNTKFQDANLNTTRLTTDQSAAFPDTLNIAALQTSKTVTLKKPL